MAEHENKFGALLRVGLCVLAQVTCLWCDWGPRVAPTEFNTLARGHVPALTGALRGSPAKLILVSTQAHVLFKFKAAAAAATSMFLDMCAWPKQDVNNSPFHIEARYVSETIVNEF